jgi:hypothetical protein
MPNFARTSTTSSPCARSTTLVSRKSSLNERPFPTGASTGRHARFVCSLASCHIIYSVKTTLDGRHIGSTSGYWILPPWTFSNDRTPAGLITHGLITQSDKAPLEEREVRAALPGPASGGPRHGRQHAYCYVVSIVSCGGVC